MLIQMHLKKLKNFVPIDDLPMDMDEDLDIIIRYGETNAHLRSIGGDPNRIDFPDGLIGPSKQHF